MVTDNSNNQTVSGRILAALPLALYLSIWTLLFYAAHTVRPEEFDAGYVLGLIVVAGVTFLAYFIDYLVLCLMSKGIKRKEYLIRLLIVLLPVIVAIIDIKTGIKIE